MHNTPGKGAKTYLSFLAGFQEPARVCTATGGYILRSHPENGRVARGAYHGRSRGSPPGWHGRGFHPNRIW
jgi:hypothetical protein